MADWHPLQTSFSAGEVSSRLALRTDIEQYKSAVKTMENWIPTPQGTAERAPGTRYYNELGAPDDDACRIIPFRDAAEQENLLILYPGGFGIQTGLDLGQGAGGNVAVQSAADPIQNAINIVQNESFIQRDLYWDYTTVQIESQGPGTRRVTSTTGVSFLYRDGIYFARIYSKWNRELSNTTYDQHLRQKLTVVTPSNSLEYLARGIFDVIHVAKPETFEEDPIGYKITFSSTDAYDGDLGESPVTQVPQQEGRFTYTQSGSISLPTNDWVGDVYLSLETEINLPPDSKTAGTIGSFLDLDTIQVLAAAEPPEGPPGVDDQIVTHYTEAELDDVQYVQSPYSNLGAAVTKELVLVHPNHPPRRIYWDFVGGVLVYQDIQFIKLDPGPDAAPVVDFTPPEWGTGSYPASVTAYQGRLILGGGGSNSEDVICSVSGQWANLFDIEANQNLEGTFPASAIKFTTTFRSRIQWMAGQKDLFIGANDLEYRVAAAGGLLRPGDIDARVQTTHGSNTVQPVGMGDEVVFPAEHGYKVRSLKFDRDYSANQGGYQAIDLTLLAPFIASSGIRRMIRIRNPHQMLICVLNSGEVAILHYEPNIGVVGWSRMSTRGRYIDACVMQNDLGVDVPMFVVQRFKPLEQAGERKNLYLEGIPNWTFQAAWNYLDSYVGYGNATQTNVYTGLNHLEGRIVMVVGDGAYYGKYKVVDGTVTIVNGYDEPQYFTYALIGLPKTALLETLPPVVDNDTTGGVGALKNFQTVGVRMRYSRPPIINGTRPPDRKGAAFMDQPIPILELTDVEVTNTGWDLYQTISIEEDLPVRCELLGIYGDLTSNKL